MKFAIQLLLIALLAFFGAAATVDQKPVIISYPKDTPQSVLDEAMETIRKAGGVITHEYSIIRGFAAKASTEAMDTVKAWGTKHDVIIEEDQVITTNND
ncbi:uncharacterized protein LTR77_002765 [Saxophila tyrrhenica]|uniref:Uncharacterized protein n=1 Tax=Saxophila tyrrhenica TaxID=1690608 RepID=A0AAV9PGD3_9PEZI|nr:hypothetical protein LTR77_002765 [Saxophila tyrrhenica]